MNNPTYLVNISYVPPVVSGQQLVSINGVTQSLPTYSSDFFVASMPEIRLVATGSSYQQALTNLLNTATASTFNDPGTEPLSRIRFS
jgi:hypothetical protein